MSGRFAHLAILAALLSGATAQADIFSPGDLARPHANLEGLKNCTLCHRAGQQLGAERCLACHTELQPQLKAGTGFHGHLPASERDECQKCHREHQGKDFPLIQWVPSKKGFPHERTGFALRGKHAAAECSGCHQRRRLEEAAIRALLEKQPRRETYLGLSSRCAACHFDEHRGQLGAKCETCHNEQAWRPASGFDHARTDYPLTGKHRSVACTECHAAQKDTQTPADAFPAPVSRSFAAFGDLPHASCTNCHSDPHDNRFGQNCQSCHTTEGWRTVKSPGTGTRGFHDKTRFPLKGRHEDVPCQSCHGPFPGKAARFKGLPSASCTDCHADAHLGQLARAGTKAILPCEECHSVDGFTPARFEVPEHAKTRYPLEGAHRAVACSACHPRRPELAKRIPPSVEQDLKRRRRPERFSFALFDIPQAGDRCERCHADPHAGQFAARVAAQGCTACHQLTSFSDVRFDHTRESLFPLTGKHAQTACGSCHTAEKGQPVRYKSLPTDCASCHADVHAGQFAPAPGQPTDCARCHSNEGFTSSVRFMHAPPFTSFTLEGKHASAACKACHPAVEVAPGTTTRRYKPLPTTCEGCHADFHQGAFRGFLP